MRRRWRGRRDFRGCRRRRCGLSVRRSSRRRGRHSRSGQGRRIDGQSHHQSQGFGDVRARPGLHRPRPLDLVPAPQHHRTPWVRSTMQGHLDGARATIRGHEDPAPGPRADKRLEGPGVRASRRAGDVEPEGLRRLLRGRPADGPHAHREREREGKSESGHSLGTRREAHRCCRVRAYVTGAGLRTGRRWQARSRACVLRGRDGRVASRSYFGRGKGKRPAQDALHEDDRLR